MTCWLRARRFERAFARHGEDWLPERESPSLKRDDGSRRDPGTTVIGRKHLPQCGVFKGEKGSIQMEQQNISRRSVLKASAAGAISAAALAAIGTNFAHAAGSSAIKVGLIGCGGRGTGAAHDSAAGSGGIKIVSIGDVFKD